MTIKMVTLDLDGTALDERGKLSERTKAAFRAAQEKGVHIVIATGRCEHSLPQELFETEGLEYLITSNGARTISAATEQVYYENYIDPAAIRAVYDLLKPRGVYIDVFFDGRAYISNLEYEAIRVGEITTRNRNYVLNTRQPVTNIYELLLENQDHIENININCINQEEKRYFAELLKQIDHITVTQSTPLNHEIGGETTSKADALSHLLNMLGLRREELMVCGDSPNDIAMIRYAGLGVAMGNAEAEVMAAADVVTAPNDEDGVALAIERYVL